MYIDAFSEQIEYGNNKWVKRFLEMAILVANWSKQESTKVGCVIVDSKNRVISVGYNGYAKGVSDSYNVSREEKLRRTIHAEENAILFANRSLEGTVVYVTHHPCASCTAKLIQVGVSKVFYLKAASGFEERWKDDINSSEEMIKESTIILHEVILEG